MSLQLKLAAALIFSYCAFVIALQSWTVFSAPEPNPKLAVFAEQWRIKSTITAAATVVVGFALVAALVRRQTMWRILGLAVFSGFCLLNNYATNLDIYFRHPLGDGSLASAVARWWRLHSYHAWFHIPSILFLATSAVLLLASAYRVHTRRLD